MTIVQRLRYDAYRSVEAIPAHQSQLFFDEYDAATHCISHLLLRDNLPVASIRACIHEAGTGWQQLPAHECYAHEIQSAIGSNVPIVESNRFVVDPVHEKALSKQTLILFRAIAANALLHDAKWIITAVREEHAPFYSRIMAFRKISGPKTYPRLSVKMVLMAACFERDWLTVSQRVNHLTVSQEDLARYVSCGIVSHF